MKNKRIAAFILALAVLLSLASPVLATEQVIHIKTVDDWMELAKNCRLDTWSVGKTVVLQNDISMEGVAFTPIPTFGGTFDGNGHTISGVELLDGTTPIGLFNTLQKTAVVKNLTAKAMIAPSGEATIVGGIVGENHGVLRNCHFEGSVIGESDIGGIAGINSADGAITECTAAGVIIGENMTGGIAGQNQGIITSCVNKAQVNTVSVDPTINLEDLNSDFLMDIRKWTSLDTSASTMDTGGIAGYSTGNILSSTNNGQIGYPHVGYNVGGIAGRSCGYISNSVNNGIVHGRKDVGGIVGQMEPNIALNLSDDTLGQLEKELNALRTLLEEFKDSSITAAGGMHNRADTILSYLDGATQSAENLAQAAGNYTDSVIGEFNRGSLILTDVLKQLEGITNQMTAFFDATATGLAQLETAMGEFAVAAELTGEAVADMEAALEDMHSASEDAELAAGLIMAGLADLKNAISTEDLEQARVALAQIQQGFVDFSAACQQQADTLHTIVELLKEGNALPEDIAASAKEFANGIEAGATALKSIADGIALLPTDPMVDVNGLNTGIDKIVQGFSALSNAMKHAEDAAKDTEAALQKVEGVSVQMATAMQSLATAMGTFSGAATKLKDVSQSVESLLQSINTNTPLQIPEADPDIQKNMEQMFININSMSDELKQLNQQADTYGKDAIEKMDAISAKFETILGLALEVAGQTLNPETDDIISDTSDANIDGVKAGKVLGCLNAGTVEGDLNIGGIAGSMSIEYELDPEDDLTSSISGTQQRVYELKSIVQDCVNSGAITAKRSYVGGIVGQMNLGLALSCENYGYVVSESGDYVGGIAGITSAKIKACFVKSSLSGRKYVGGIAGSGVAETIGGAVSKIIDCYSMVEIVSAKQYFGAISGGKTGEFSGNFFVSDVLAGVNGISYSGKAEPMQYAALLQLADLPENFQKLSVQFVADGEVLKSILVNYGDTIDQTAFPEIPGKEGCYATWEATQIPDIRFDTVIHVVYTPFTTVLQTEDSRSNGRPIFIAEGQFEDQQMLVAQSVTKTPGAFSVIAETWKDTLWKGFTEGKIYLDVAEQWTLALPDDGIGSHAVRYLPSNQSADYAIFVKENDAWQEVEITAIGSYLSFSVTGTEVEIAVLSTANVWWLWFIPLAFAILLILLIGFLVKRIRRSIKLRPKKIRKTKSETGKFERKQ